MTIIQSLMVGVFFVGGGTGRRSDPERKRSAGGHGFPARRWARVPESNPGRMA
jgi:hypothetical protein